MADPPTGGSAIFASRAMHPLLNRTFQEIPDGVRTPYVRLATSMPRNPENDLQIVTGDGVPIDDNNLEVDRGLYIRRSGPGDAVFYVTQDRGRTWTPLTSGSGSGVFSLTSFRETTSYPDSAAVGEHLDCGGAGGTIVLPETRVGGAALVAGDTCRIRSTLNALTVQTSDGSLVNGAASKPLVQYEVLNFFWTGSGWGIF